MTSVKSLLLNMLFTFAALIAATAAQAQSSTRVEVGVLNCNVAGGSGFVFGSSKSLSCTLQRSGPNERYRGTITKYGIDVGTTKQSVLAWAVFAPTKNVPRGALRGSYNGVSGEATIGVGLGANVLIGGSDRTIVLQPLSVQARQGLNIAAGVASRQLR